LTCSGERILGSIFKLLQACGAGRPGRTLRFSTSALGRFGWPLLAKAALRAAGLGLMLGLLSACSEPEPPASAVTPVASEGVSGAVQPPPATEAPPVATEVSVPVPPAAPRLERPRRSPPMPVVQEPALPEVELDLSLPAELLERLEPEALGMEMPSNKPLLPPLFAEKPDSQNQVQLNARLITDDDEEDYLKSVEGAEFQFQFNR